jgi:hypothetical protein
LRSFPTSAAKLFIFYGAQSANSMGIRGLFLLLKRLTLEADHSASSIAEVKNEWSGTSSLQDFLMA